MSRMRSLLRIIGVGAVVLLIAQVSSWFIAGDNMLDDQFYRDEVAGFVAASLGRLTDSRRILVCQARLGSLSASTLKTTTSQLEDAGLERVTTGDLAPLGGISPDDCSCYSVCYEVLRNSPAIGVVSATFRPTITHSQTGKRYLYFFLLGHWVRVGEYGGWEQ